MSMPHWMAKFDLLADLEAAFGHPDPGQRRQALTEARDWLLGNSDLSSVGGTVAGVDLDAPSAQQQIQHMFDDWMSGSYWPNIPADTIHAEILEGFAWAYTTALDGVRREIRRHPDGSTEEVEDRPATVNVEPPLPVTFTWVCATGDSNADFFRVGHVIGPNGVTIVVGTPWPATIDPPDVEILNPVTAAGDAAAS